MSFGVCDSRQRRNSKTLWHACIRLMRACHICMTLHDHGLLCTSAINLGLHALTLLLSQTDGRTDRQMDVFYFFIKHVLTFFILVMNVFSAQSARCVRQNVSLRYCHDVRPSVWDSGTGVHCNHTVHFNVGLSLCWIVQCSGHPDTNACPCILPTVFFPVPRGKRWGMDVQTRSSFLIISKYVVRR